MTKRCHKCQEDKDVAAFSKCRANPDGLQFKCKPCQQAATRACNARRDPAEIKAQKQDWYQRNRPSILAHYATKAPERRARSKAWAKANPERQKQLHGEYKQRRSPEQVAFEQFERRLKRWGLTLDQYHAMVESQDFLCAVCKEVPEIDESHKRQSIDGFVVDHDHVTGRIRALTCSNCNVGIGMLQDSPERLTAAAAYLTAHHAKRQVA